VRVEGRILRQGPEGTAVQFLAIDPQGLFHLRNLVRYNAADVERVEREIQRRPGLK
jgi:hypothetical protein